MTKLGKALATNQVFSFSFMSVSYKDPLVTSQVFAVTFVGVYPHQVDKATKAKRSKIVLGDGAYQSMGYVTLASAVQVVQAHVYCTSVCEQQILEGI